MFNLEKCHNKLWRIKRKTILLYDMTRISNKLPLCINNIKDTGLKVGHHFPLFVFPASRKFCDKAELNNVLLVTDLTDCPNPNISEHDVVEIEISSVNSLGFLKDSSLLPGFCNQERFHNSWVLTCASDQVRTITHICHNLSFTVCIRVKSYVVACSSPVCVHFNCLGVLRPSRAVADVHTHSVSHDFLGDWSTREPVSVKRNGDWFWWKRMLV